MIKHIKYLNFIVLFCCTIHPKNEKTVIFVLGTARSGTSVTTGLLQILGLDLCDDKNLLKANENNPKGFFENEKISKFNIKICENLGLSNFDYLPDKMDFNNNYVNALKNKIKKSFVDHYKDKDFFALKDVNICYILPFYLQIAKELNLKVKFIIILRDPFEIIKSRNKVSKNTTTMLSCTANQGFEVVLSNFLPIAKYTKEYDRLAFTYDDLLNNSEKIIDKINDFIPQTKKYIDVKQSVEQFIDKNLKHNKSKNTLVENLKKNRFSRIDYQDRYGYQKKLLDLYKHLLFSTQFIEPEYLHNHDIQHFIEKINKKNNEIKKLKKYGLDVENRLNILDGYFKSKLILMDQFDTSVAFDYLKKLLIKKSINFQDIIELHKIMFEDVPEAGKLRKFEIQNLAVDPKEINNEMNKFISYLNSNKNDLIQAANIGWKFLVISPFAKGNGRISRLLMNYYLMKNKYPPIFFDHKNMEKYHLLMDLIRQNNLTVKVTNLEPNNRILIKKHNSYLENWYKFFVSNFYSQLHEYQSVLSY